MQANGSLRVSSKGRPNRVVSERSIRRGLAGVAQSVEHLFCKQVVRGSSPLASSKTKVMEGCPSGQREQAVNLPASAYVGSNPTPSTRSVVSSRGRCRSARRMLGGAVRQANGARWESIAGVAQLVERQPSKLNVEGSNPFSRSKSPCFSLAAIRNQAEGGLQCASGVQGSAPLGFPLPT